MDTERSGLVTQSGTGHRTAGCIERLEPSSADPDDYFCGSLGVHRVFVSTTRLIHRIPKVQTPTRTHIGVLEIRRRF